MLELIVATYPVDSARQASALLDAPKHSEYALAVTTARSSSTRTMSTQAAGCARSSRTCGAVARRAAAPRGQSRWPVDRWRSSPPSAS